MEGDEHIELGISILLLFQSTPSVWRETYKYRFGDMTFDISIHSLRMEGDTHTAYRFRISSVFQSTPSAWRETVSGITIDLRFTISIHSLRMEGDQARVAML